MKLPVARMKNLHTRECVNYVKFFKNNVTI